MKKSGIFYSHSKKRNVEAVFCKNSDFSYPEHNHTSVFTVGLVLEGSIELKRKSQQTICNAGDFFIIPPYEPHAISAIETEYSLLTVCINKDFVNEDDSPDILADVLELLDDPVQKKLISADQMTSLIDVIDLLFASAAGFTLLIDETIDSAKTILEKEPEHSLNIEQLSKQIFVSKYHLIREFKEQVGLTPHQFQMQNRIRKAQCLLKEGMSITEVALAMGFYDQSHFNKWFKRVVALTPSEYMLACGKLPDRIDD